MAERRGLAAMASIAANSRRVEQAGNVGRTSLEELDSRRQCDGKKEEYEETRK